MGCNTRFVAQLCDVTEDTILWSLCLEKKKKLELHLFNEKKHFWKLF